MILQESADLEQSTKGLCLEIRPEKKKMSQEKKLTLQCSQRKQESCFDQLHVVFSVE